MNEQGHAGSAGEIVATLIALAAAGVSGALLFAVAEGGYATFPRLIVDLAFPGVAILVVVTLVAWRLGWRRLSAGILAGAAAGALANIGLEIVRVTGFRAFDSMPGSMPMLMGTLLTHRIMQGPNLLSDLAGWADHFWNGAAFGIIFVLLFGARRPVWVGAVYGLVLGTGFLLSPVPMALGTGHFGLQYAGFVPTVYIAHLVFGAGIAWLARRSRWAGDSLWAYGVKGRSAAPAQ